jgi:hypothetical protein
VEAVALRLAGRPDHSDLGPHERSVLAKYGSDDILAALREPEARRPEVPREPAPREALVLDSLRHPLRGQADEEDAADEEA